MFLDMLNIAYVPGHAKAPNTPVKDNWYWGPDRIQRENAVYDSDPNQLIFNGEGVHVFVVDTGVNLNHAEFAGRVGTSFRVYGIEGDEEATESARLRHLFVNLW